MQKSIGVTVLLNGVGLWLVACTSSAWAGWKTRVTWQNEPSTSPQTYPLPEAQPGTYDCSFNASAVDGNVSVEVAAFNHPQAPYTPNSSIMYIVQSTGNYTRYWEPEEGQETPLEESVTVVSGANLQSHASASCAPQTGCSARGKCTGTATSDIPPSRSTSVRAEVRATPSTPDPVDDDDRNSIFVGSTVKHTGSLSYTLHIQLNASAFRESVNGTQDRGEASGNGTATIR